MLIYNNIFDSYFFGSKVEDKSAKVESDENKSTITIDVPGYKKEEIDVVVDDNILFVKLDGMRGKKSYKFSLNGSANIDGITSKLEDGVLTILVERKKDNVKKIKIG